MQASANQARPPRHLLVGVELHAAGAAAAVAAAGALAQALAAEVILAGIAPLEQPPLVTEPTPAFPRVLELGPMQAEIDRLTMAHVEAVAEALPRAVPRRSVLCWGPAGPAIVEAAQREGADLVVVPMRRAGAIGHVLNDGADRHVLHHCGVPVVVVPVDDAPGSQAAAAADQESGACT
jgi:nucleotide-binding universal stress UspA family protein